MGEAFKDVDLIFTADDGYAPPLLGGPVNCKWGNFAYTNVASSEAELFTLPAGAQIVGWAIAPTAGFDGTNPVLDVGDGTAADKFAADLALADSKATITAGFEGDEMFSALAAETTFYATYAEDADGTAGAAVIGVHYVIVPE